MNRGKTEQTARKMAALFYREWGVAVGLDDLVAQVEAGTVHPQSPAAELTRLIEDAIKSVHGSLRF